MKKYFLAALIALAPAFAQAQGFIELGYGQSKADLDISLPGVSIDEKDSTFAISGGYMFNPNFGAEIGYRDLGEINATGPGGSVSIGVTGFMLGGVGRFHVAERLSIVPRFGLYLWDVDVSASSGLSDSESGSDIYFGIGADFQINKQVHVGLHFARFDIDGDDVDVIEAKLGFSF